MSAIILTPTRNDLPDCVADSRAYYFTRGRNYSLMGYAVVAGLHTSVTPDELIYEDSDLRIIFHKFAGDIRILYKPINQQQYKLVLFLLGDDKIATFREGKRWVELLEILYKKSEVIREGYILDQLYEDELMNFTPIED